MSPTSAAAAAAAAAAAIVVAGSATAKATAAASSHELRGRLIMLLLLHSAWPACPNSNIINSNKALARPYLRPNTDIFSTRYCQLEKRLNKRPQMATLGTGEVGHAKEHINRLYGQHLTPNNRHTCHIHGPPPPSQIHVTITSGR